MSSRRQRRGDAGSRAHSYLKEAAGEMEHQIFVWDGGGRRVFLIGSFNNWVKTPLTAQYG